MSEFLRPGIGLDMLVDDARRRLERDEERAEVVAAAYAALLIIARLDGEDHVLRALASAVARLAELPPTGHACRCEEFPYAPGGGR